MASDPEQPAHSSFAKEARSGGEIGSAIEPLLNGVHDSESYSVSAAILPFLFPALGGLLFGYDIGATSSATISIQSPTLSGVSWYKLSSVEIGLLTSGSLYGALIGSLLAFNVADFLGRRKELIGAAVVYLVGALVTALAPNFPVLVLGRLVFGIGIGLAMHAAPMYIAETAPTPIRGQLISLKEFFIVLGMVVSSSALELYGRTLNSKYPGITKNDYISFIQAGYGIGSLFVETVSGWRYMYGVSSPVAIIMGVGMCWLPASPRWLLLRAIQGKGDVQNSKDIAIRSLCQLRGQAFYDSVPRQVDEILAELSYLGEEKEATFGELFQGKCLKALWIGSGLVLFQQAANYDRSQGNQVCSTMLDQSFRVQDSPEHLMQPESLFSLGFSSSETSLVKNRLIMTGVAVVVVDKLGRRPLLLGGVSGIVISLFFLGSYYIFLDNSPVVAVIGLLLYVGSYQISFGPIGWLMIAEIFPLRLRGRGLSIAVLVNFGANALVTFAFSPLKALLGAGILFYTFCVIAVASLVFIYFVIPETKGLTLEEIEAKCL
ncbi:D-xylose-proton symporter-like 2 [Glycine soja]